MKEFVTVCQEYIGRSDFQTFYKLVMLHGITRENILKACMSCGYRLAVGEGMADRLKLPKIQAEHP